MGMLTDMGLVRDRKENKENIWKWLSMVLDNTGLWILKCLSGLNRTLFQRRGMPANYLNYRIGRFRHI